MKYRRFDQRSVAWNRAALSCSLLCGICLIPSMVLNSLTLKILTAGLSVCWLIFMIAAYRKAAGAFNNTDLGMVKIPFPGASELFHEAASMKKYEASQLQGSAWKSIRSRYRRDCEVRLKRLRMMAEITFNGLIIMFGILFLVCVWTVIISNSGSNLHLCIVTGASVVGVFYGKCRYGDRISNLERHISTVFSGSIIPK